MTIETATAILALLILGVALNLMLFAISRAIERHGDATRKTNEVLRRIEPILNEGLAAARITASQTARISAAIHATNEILYELDDTGAVLLKERQVANVLAAADLFVERNSHSNFGGDHFGKSNASQFANEVRLDDALLLYLERHGRELSGIFTDPTIEEPGK